jgi:hypothetical protein
MNGSARREAVGEKMNRFLLSIFSAISILFAGDLLRAFAQPAEPDFDLAYVLATASYCAYTVGEVDADGGLGRAIQCLNTAAKRDGDYLGLFQDIKEDSVEAFFNPSAPEDAYLLINTPSAVILAFRGTLTPPISPASGRFLRAAKDAVDKYQAREANLFATFIGDWWDNFKAIPNARSRHGGFDTAWLGLSTPLVARNCSPGANDPARGCSKFRSFIGGLPGAVSPKLYITGHSKGGALAMLAALDLPNLVGTTIVPVVYTFAGAKAWTADGANAAAAAMSGVWRFEHEWHIVPNVPFDRTVSPLFSYAHVGNRVFFAKGKPPAISSGPDHGVDLPGDRGRLLDSLTHLVGSLGRGLLQNLSNIFNGPDAVLKDLVARGLLSCRAVVDSHFLVFADVWEAAHSKRSSPSALMTTTEENLSQSFFYTGLPDEHGEILWGFSQWCPLLIGPRGSAQQPN